MKRSALFIFFFSVVMFSFPFQTGLAQTSGTENEEKKPETPVIQTSLPLKLSGYAQLQAVEKNEATDSFSIKRARLSLGGNLLPKLRFKLQVDLTKSPVLLDALAEVIFRQEINLRLGQFLVPFSLENLSPTSELLTINRSQTVEKLAPGRDNGAIGRDIGLAMFGSYSIFEYTTGLVNGSGLNKTDTNDHKDFVGRLVARPLKEISVGFSVYNGRQTVAGNPANLLRNKTGLELAVNYRRFNLRAEYIQARDDQIKKQGWYVLGAYSIIKDKLQFVARFEAVDPDRSLPANRITIYTVGANWLLTARSKLQANYEYYREEAAANHHAALIQLQLGF